MIVLGFVAMYWIGLDGLWLAMIGWFLYGSASAASRISSSGSTAPRSPDRVGHGTVLRLCVAGLDAHLAHSGMGVWIPVLDPWGAPLGVVESAVLERYRLRCGASTRVREVMRELRPGGDGSGWEPRSVKLAGIGRRRLAPARARGCRSARRGDADCRRVGISTRWSRARSQSTPR